MLAIQKNVNLSFYSTWRVGGSADFFVEPQSIEDLKRIETISKERKLPITLLGGGTNCLISDAGIRGLVVSLRKLVGLSYAIEGDFFKIECLSGTPKILLTKIFLSHQLAPAVFLSGIPGCVAGGVVMNAGVSENIIPCQFSEIVDWIDVVRDNQIIRKNQSDIQWSYRNSRGWQPGIIARVGLKWPLQRITDLSQIVKKERNTRIAKQPLEQASCGSTFVNPKNAPTAGHLIEKNGLKGFRIGQAQVSKKHANFIVNLGGAKARDIHLVIQHVQKNVQDRTGVHLSTEIKYLGDWL